MSINIKNVQTVRLIRQLAELTGKGQTEAVTEAVAERIERLKSQKRTGRLERMTAIADKMAPRFKQPYDMIDHGALLYDEQTGLPK